MRTEEDALRSVKRYVSVVLGDEWEVRLWADQGTFQTPFARVVASASGATFQGAGAMNGWESLPVSVYLYPGALETEESAALTTMRLRERMLVAFRLGGVENEGYPLRVPLYDYEGVDYPIGAGVRRGVRDFLRVSDLDVARVADDQDERFPIVVVSMRLGWARSSALAADRIAGTTLESVQVTTVVEKESQVVRPVGVGSSVALGVPVLT